MAAGRLLWALLLAVLLALTLCTGSAAACAVCMLLLLLPLLALGCDVVCARHVRCALDAPVNLQKGAQGALRLTLQNGAALPVCRAVCRVEVQNLLTGERALLRAACGLTPHGKQTVELQLSAAHAGRLRVHVDEVRLYDAFGLLGVRGAAQATAGVTVQPDTFRQQVIILPADAPRLDAERYAPDRPGPDLTEPFQIRDYAPGDSRRQILWKLSGKYDRLIVKDASLPVQQDILVFWERTVRVVRAARAGRSHRRTAAAAVRGEGRVRRAGLHAAGAGGGAGSGISFGLHNGKHDPGRGGADCAAALWAREHFDLRRRCAGRRRRVRRRTLCAAAANADDLKGGRSP